MLKKRWLNAVLRLTNRIYKQKQSIEEASGPGIVFSLIGLVFGEVLLAIISAPLYLGVKSGKVEAYFEEKGGYEKISFDYNLRRVLTLTGLGVIFVIWAIKLLLIFLTPTVFGPLQLYKVSDFEPVDLIEDRDILTEIQMQTAEVNDEIEIPKLIGIDKLGLNNYRFYGRGQTETEIVILLSDVQVATLVSEVDNSGLWEVELTDADFKLSEGNHQVIAYGFDKERGFRSELSNKQYFRIETTFIDKLVNNADIFLNITIIVIIILGILLTTLTL